MSLTMETHNYRIGADESHTTFVAEKECVTVELPPTLVNSEPITIYNKTEANKVIVYYLCDGVKKDVAELNVDTSLVFYPNVLDGAWETVAKSDAPYTKIIGAALNCNEVTTDIPLKGLLPSTMLVSVRVFRGETFSDVCHLIRTPYITNCLVDCIAGPFSNEDRAIVSFHIEEGNTLVAYPTFIGEVSNISICVYG
jgi:hypothetical protein